MTDSVKENSTAFVTLTFSDKDGNPLTPDSVYIEIIDKLSGTSVRANSEEAPAASSMVVELLPAHNAILNSKNPSEERRIIVQATYASTRKLNESWDYTVINLSKIS
jgi:hypothetical protein